MEYALVVAAEVRPSGLGDEPLTVAVLRSNDGGERTVSILGGPTARGGFSRPAGFVVPVLGARVRLDLVAEPTAPRSSLAWTKGGALWPTAALPVVFSLALPGSRDLGLEAGAEIDVAARTWSTVSCTALRAKYGGTTSAPAGDDGVNVVYWHDDVWPAMLTPKGLAQTMLHTDANGDLRDADVHVNGVDYKWSLEGAGATPDARSILTHEMGHAIGFAHSGVAGATMFATYPPGIAWRSLEQDDRDGVCALYPGKGAQGCDASACPTNFVCVAGACERKGAQGVVCAPCERKPGACAGAGDDARCIDLGAPPRGRVCGRACAVDADCGARFHCLPTTTSGDLQCVSDDGCATGPDACVNDVDCVVGSCKGGACVGAMPSIGDAGVDATTDGGISVPVKAGCSCDAGPRGETRDVASRITTPIATLALLLALRRRRKP